MFYVFVVKCNVHVNSSTEIAGPNTKRFPVIHWLQLNPCNKCVYQNFVDVFMQSILKSKEGRSSLVFRRRYRGCYNYLLNGLKIY